jgi:tetratricopeptide (TPR) repeat protein
MVVLSIVVLILFVAFYSYSNYNSSGNLETISHKDILKLWDERHYEKVLQHCDEALELSPLDPFYLTLKGFASFYLGVSESDSEKRTVMMDTAIFSLRKALVNKDVPLRPEAMYILGKSYFHKGIDYYGEANDYLNESLQAGYSSYDTLEYLALAAYSSGQLLKSVEYYEKALSLRTDSPELIISAAIANKAQGNIEKAEFLATNALAMTSDTYLAERSNFLLGEILLSSGRYTEALTKFEEIIENNPYSADAWFYQGLIFADTGDPIKARAAWRKAVSIDPMHSGARQKLSERS